MVQLPTTTRRKYLRATGVAGAVGLTGLAGCVQQLLDDADARYGVLMPITGDLGPVGGPIRDGALLPARQIEDADVGLTIDTEVGDTQTDPETGISEANRLVDGGYPAVVGPAGSDVNLRVAPSVLIPNEVVGISPSSTAPPVTDLDDEDFIFRTAPSDALQGPVIADVAFNRLDGASTGTLGLNDEYGIALESAYVDAFEEEGGTVMNRVSFEPEQPSYTSELSEALDGDPDILFIVGFPVSGVQMFRDYYADFADDFDGTIVVPDGLQDPELPGEVGNPMNDVFGTAPSAAGPGADEFQNLYTQEYDRDPGVFTSHGYDAAAVVLLAGIAAGDASGVGVRDNMRTVANPSGTEVGPDNLPEAAEMVANGESVNYQGASSFVDFDDNGDMQAVAYEIFKYTDGEIEVLDLFEFGA